ncbi:MAG: hypothetical protein KC422_02055 [Trueperaceae bacterium]|nr:hypothetical protein [Trueperaceae bacterium]
MIRLEQVALELLEYKLKDISDNRDVRGGVASAWDLHHFLDKAQLTLSETEKARFSTAAQELRRLGTAPGKVKSALDTFEELVLDSFSDLGSGQNTASAHFEEVHQEILEANFESFDNYAIDAFGVTPEAVSKSAVLSTEPEFEREQSSLQDLASIVWWHDMEEVIQQLAVRCRVEKDRSMARLLYAITRNIQQALNSPSFSEDFAQGIVQVQIPITDFDDPLVSFSNLESLTQLVKDVIESIVHLGMKGTIYADLGIDRSYALDYTKRLAVAIAKDPYAGKLSAVPSKGPSSAQIRIAIQELAKEPLREDERKQQKLELEARLQLTLEQERRLKSMLEQDSKRFMQSAQAFFDRLEPFLPQRVGGQASDPSLPPGVLFALNPALVLTQIPKDAKAVTIRLNKEPVRLMLSSNEIGISQLEHGITLMINHYEYPLIDQLKIDMRQQKLYAFLKDDYIHLKLKDDSKSLAASLAEAMAVLFVLSSSQRDELLKVIKTAANVAVGEPQMIIENAIQRLRDLSDRAPSRRRALDGLLRGAARALATDIEENLMMGLVQRLITAMAVSSDDLTVVLEGTDSTQAFVHQLGNDPLSLTIGKQMTTIRKYKARSESATESLVVMLPGRIIGSFTRTLIQPFPGGTIICVRAADELAVLYFENTFIESEPIF